MSDDRDAERRVYRDLEQRASEDAEDTERKEKGAFATKLEEVSKEIEGLAGDGGSLATYMGVGAGMGLLGDYLLPVRNLPIIGPVSRKVMTAGGALSVAARFFVGLRPPQSDRRGL